MFSLRELLARIKSYIQPIDHQCGAEVVKRLRDLETGTDLLSLEVEPDETSGTDAKSHQKNGTWY